jgi:AAA domain
LVVFDPLQSFLGAKVDMNRANEVRSTLNPLAALAERHQSAFLIIRHFTKKEYSNPLYRGMTSIDFAGTARSVLQVSRTSEGEDERIMTHVKQNLTGPGKSAVFTIQGGTFGWRGFSDLTAYDLLAKPKRPQQIAEEFLSKELAAGPRSAKEISEKAEKVGISQGTLKRARKNLRVQSKPNGFRGQHRMSLPKQVEPEPEAEV